MNGFDELKQVKTLLVDDDEFIRNSLELAFKTKGCCLQVAESAEEGLRTIKDQQFDIIISDIRMREIDGIQVMNHVFQKSKKTKVILITGYATLELARESLTKGAFDFIAKPFKSKEIRTTIGRALEALNKEESQPSSVPSL